MRVATWNIAAINNNPFESWITPPKNDAKKSYETLMRDVENFILSPGDEDTWMSMEKMVKGPILGTLKNISLTMLTYAGLTYLGYKLFRSRVDSR